MFWHKYWNTYLLIQPGHSFKSVYWSFFLWKAVFWSSVNPYARSFGTSSLPTENWINFQASTDDLLLEAIPCIKSVSFIYRFHHSRITTPFSCQVQPSSLVAKFALSTQLRLSAHQHLLAFHFRTFLHCAHWIIFNTIR